MESGGNVILFEEIKKRREIEEKLVEEEFIEREKLTDAEMKLETKIDAKKKMKGEKFTFKQKWFPNIYDAEQIEIAKTGNYVARGTKQLFGRWIRSMAIAGLMFWGAYQGLGNNITRDEGEYEGRIEYVNNEGTVFKTREGKLSLEEKTNEGYYIDSGYLRFSLDGSIRNKDHTDKIYTQLKNFAEENQRVKITYERTLAIWPWRAKTKYLIQDVESVVD